MEIKAEWKSFGGAQRVVEHESSSCGVPMQFSIYLPPNSPSPPVVYFLSGLTCSWENVTTKGQFQRAAAELGLAIVAPDTSPRGPEVPDAEEGRWDLGKAAGFYVDATAEPWSTHYNMYSYVTEELPALIGASFAVDHSRCSVMGHSMGGHGALVLGLRNPELYRSISAFAPICAPSQVQWGRDAFSTYLQEESEWGQYDADRLVQSGETVERPILIDQGSADGFLQEQLRPRTFEKTCQEAGQPLQLRLQEGYDHSYYFISTFIDEHLRHHAEALHTT